MTITLKNNTGSTITLNSISIAAGAEITLYNDKPIVTQSLSYQLLYYATTFSTKLLSGDLTFLKDSVIINDVTEINLYKDLLFSEMTKINYIYEV